jgi:hypothetical protein
MRRIRIFYGKTGNIDHPRAAQVAGEVSAISEKLPQCFFSL